MNAQIQYRYIRVDGKHVIATVKGVIISLVAFDTNNNPVDSWDGIKAHMPGRWIERRA